MIVGRRLFIVAVAILITPLTSLAQPATQPSGGYVFTYFINNGEDGLHLATSRDGYHFKAAGGGKSFLPPTVGESKLMRDPCVEIGPDGVYQLVWTDSWTGQTIGHASSRDLIHWSAEQAIPVMSYEPTVLNTWAPEVHYDRANDQFVIFWASTIPGKFPETQNTGDGKYNHRIYATTTRDFATFTPTRLFFDPGFNTIDATVIPAGNRFCLIVKDETLTPVKKNLRLAWSDKMEGPYTDVSAPFTRDWVEGPTAIDVGGAEGSPSHKTLVFYDCYKDHHYGAMRTGDFKTWEDVTDQISIPAGARHGTIIAVPERILAGLEGI